MGRNKKNGEKNGREERRGLGLTPELNLARETKRGVAVVVFVILSLLSLLVLTNVAGQFGQVLLRFLRTLFGVMAYLTPVALALVAYQLSRQDLKDAAREHGFYLRTYLGALITFGSIAGLIHLFYLSPTTSAFSVAGQGQAGGYLGALFAQPFYALFGFWASSIILFGLTVIGVLVTFNVALSALWPRPQAPLPQGAQEVKVNTMGSQGFTSDRVVAKNPKLAEAEAPAEEGAKPKALETKINVPTVKADLQLEAVATEPRRDWKLPPFDLLDNNQTDVDSGNIEDNVATIKQTLADFGIEVEMGEVNVGPTVTQYTLAPAAGVKLSQISQLQSNLAMALAARSLRMELPIPGKSLVGIEVPNRTTRIVRLREVIQSRGFVSNASKLLFALGRDVAGQPLWADLSTMPHLLVAGASGKGKSVAMNCLLVSLLYRNTPQDVKFIVIDPKRVEMTPYNGIPHLLTPVIIDPEKAVNALKWAVAEMERRYKLLSEAGSKNIAEYNAHVTLTLPYLIIVVDELADLMAVAQAEMEAAVVRLAQMARAVGIHLVLATQRPSVDVLTGLIKANITSRIAFAVASQTDSRTILDSSGAEKLLGNGDMLFVSSEFDKPRRIQGAYISGVEIKKVVDFFKAQAGAVIYNEEVTEKLKKPVGGMPGDGSDEHGDDDPLFEEAKAEVTRAGKASASFLQRRLKIGYARAARLLDILEERGVVGPGEGAKPREVYGAIPPEERAEYGVEDIDEEA